MFRFVILFFVLSISTVFAYENALAIEESSLPAQEVNSWTQQEIEALGQAQRKANVLEDAVRLREEGTAQRKRGNTLLFSGIGGVALGTVLYIAGIASAASNEKNDDDDYYYYNEPETYSLSAGETALILGGVSLIALGTAGITIGIIFKSIGGRKIRRANQYEKIVFNFDPIIDIQNECFGARMTAHF